jgi:hypothetical protein
MRIALIGRVVGIALAAVVAGDLAALAATAAPHSSPAAAPVSRAAAPAAPAPSRVQAVDIVNPTPVTVVFATPTRAPRPKVAVAARTRPAVQAAPAGPTEPTGCGTPAERGSAALAALRHPIPSGVSISYLGGRSDLLGLTYLSQRHVDLYVRSCDRESDALLRHVLAHELGHAYDASRMTADLRAQYLAARGIPAGTPWMGCDRCTDFATPAGDFAETYSLWMRGGGDSRSRMAPAPSAADLAALGAQFFSRG